jgi:hypothetical protein
LKNPKFKREQKKRQTWPNELLATSSKISSRGVVISPQ